MEGGPRLVEALFLCEVRLCVGAEGVCVCVWWWWWWGGGCWQNETLAVHRINFAECTPLSRVSVAARCPPPLRACLLCMLCWGGAGLASCEKRCGRGATFSLVRMVVCVCVRMCVCVCVQPSAPAGCG
jgi:hypothetical protein